jgi:hypothetical protein
VFRIDIACGEKTTRVREKHNNKADAVEEAVEIAKRFPIEIPYRLYVVAEYDYMSDEIVFEIVNNTP